MSRGRSSRRQQPVMAVTVAVRPMPIAAATSPNVSAGADHGVVAAPPRLTAAIPERST